MPDLRTITIPSRPSYEDYVRPDFWENSAFRNACRHHGIPLDTPIPEEAFRLAEAAFNASCAFSRAWCRKYEPKLADGVCSDDAPELWRRAVEGLDERKAA